MGGCVHAITNHYDVGNTSVTIKWFDISWRQTRPMPTTPSISIQVPYKKIFLVERRRKRSRRWMGQYVARIYGECLYEVMRHRSNTWVRDRPSQFGTQQYMDKREWRWRDMSIRKMTDSVLLATILPRRHDGRGPTLIIIVLDMLLRVGQATNHDFALGVQAMLPSTMQRLRTPLPEANLLHEGKVRQILEL